MAKSSDGVEKHSSMSNARWQTVLAGIIGYGTRGAELYIDYIVDKETEEEFLAYLKSVFEKVWAISSWTQRNAGSGNLLLNTSYR